MTRTRDVAQAGFAVPSLTVLTVVDRQRIVATLGSHCCHSTRTLQQLGNNSSVAGIEVADLSSALTGGSPSTRLAVIARRLLPRLQGAWPELAGGRDGVVAPGPCRPPADRGVGLVEPERGSSSRSARAKVMQCSASSLPADARSALQLVPSS